MVTMAKSHENELFVTHANSPYDACVWTKKIEAGLSGVASIGCPRQLFENFALAGALDQDG